MNDFVDPSTFNLIFEDVVIIRVAAENVNGMGDFSVPNVDGEYVRTIPSYMNAPQRDSLTNDHQLHVFWDPLDPVSNFSEMGGSAILSYGIEWDNGTEAANWLPLSGFSSDSLDTDIIVQSGITEGEVYRFRVRARNIYGWGPPSDVLPVAAAGIPEQMEPPVTEIDPNNGLNILVTWVEPYDNSDAISAYNIIFRASDGTYHNTAECVSEVPDLGLSCSVPIATFLGSPFNLAYNDLVQVRVQATNTNDWSDLSETNIDGARIQTRPEQMDAVVRGDDTHTTNIEVHWTALTGHQTGGSPIDSYNLQWD